MEHKENWPHQHPQFRGGEGRKDSQAFSKRNISELPLLYTGCCYDGAQGPGLIRVAKDQTYSLLGHQLEKNVKTCLL